MKRQSHLKSVNESYFLHMKHAIKYTIKLAYATTSVAIHAVFPFLHQDTASKIAGDIYFDVTSRKK